MPWNFRLIVFSHSVVSSPSVRQSVSQGRRSISVVWDGSVQDLISDAFSCFGWETACFDHIMVRSWFCVSLNTVLFYFSLLPPFSFSFDGFLFVPLNAFEISFMDMPLYVSLWVCGRLLHNVYDWTRLLLKEGGSLDFVSMSSQGLDQRGCNGQTVAMAWIKYKTFGYISSHVWNCNCWLQARVILTNNWFVSVLVRKYKQWIYLPANTYYPFLQ